MYVSSPAGLTIHEFALYMGINPWEMAQIGAGFPTPSTRQCPYVWFQYAWQQDFLSREELAGTIQKAELALAYELGFWPSPRYFTQEKPYTRSFPRDLFAYGGDNRGMWKAVSVDWAKAQTAGVLARTAITAGVAVTLSDTDGDGVTDRFTCSFATTVTDPGEIGLYFTSVDRNGEALAEPWRIRPITVSIAAGTATVTGHAALLVLPDLTTITNPDVLDVTNTAIYAATLDAYRVYTDTTTTTANPAQGIALWESYPCATPPCASEVLPLCAAPRDANNGVLYVDWTLGNTQLPPQAREPDRVKINYLAGEPLVNGAMNMELGRIVAHLAAGWLPVTKCGCERSHRILAHWREPITEGDNGRAVTAREVDENPFGIQRGAVYAWQRVRELRTMRGVLV